MATLKAAAELHGICGTEYKAVQAAWNSVNVVVPGSEQFSDGFTLTASQASVVVNPSQSVTTRWPPRWRWPTARPRRSSGLPSGATASFALSSVTSGGSSALTINTTAATAPGIYMVSITGTGALPSALTGESVTNTTTVALTVGAGTCTVNRTNDTDITIPDFVTVESSVTISGCAGNAKAGSTAEVHIAFPYIGDLVVSLVAPDGSLYLMHDRTGTTNAIDKTYMVDLSGEVRNGTWTLRVQSARSDSIGFINRWTLNLVGDPCASKNSTAVTIPDNTTADSPVMIAGCARTSSATSTIAVNITHPNIAMLIITLVAPDGSLYVLRNQIGAGADLNATYTYDLSGELRAGTWKLRMADMKAQYRGHRQLDPDHLAAGSAHRHRPRRTQPRAGLCHTGSGKRQQCT